MVFYILILIKLFVLLKESKFFHDFLYLTFFAIFLNFYLYLYIQFNIFIKIYLKINIKFCLMSFIILYFKFFT